MNQYDISAVIVIVIAIVRELRGRANQYDINAVIVIVIVRELRGSANQYDISAVIVIAIAIVGELQGSAN